MHASTTQLPEEGDLIQFTDENGNEYNGVVNEVDEDADGYGTELFIGADEAGSANQELHYYEGETDEDGPFAVLSRYSPYGGKPCRIGEDVDYEVL